MNKKSHAFIRRTSAVCAAAALALSGAFIAVPANAAPDKDTTVSTAPTNEAPDAPATEAPATEGGVIDDPALAEAIARDLGMSVEEFVAAGELGTKAADAVEELSAIEGYQGIALVENKKVVVSGTGAALQAAVDELGFEFKDTAEKKVEPTKEATLTPAPLPEVLATAFDGSLEKLLAQYVEAFGAENVARAYVQGGKLVIETSVPADAKADVGDSAAFAATAMTSQDFEDKYTNVTIKRDPSFTPATPWYDLPNGHGIAMGEAPSSATSVCSVGFAAWTPEGDDAFLSAGHCSQDSNANFVSLTDPAGDIAADESLIAVDIAMFGFSQFGGPGNSPVTGEPANPGNIGTDVSIAEDLDPEVVPVPVTADWESPDDMTANAVGITSVRNPVEGEPVCKSGRTTQWSCGTVTIAEVIAYVGGFNYPADPADIRAVASFEVTMTDNFPGKQGGAPGDSGGTMIAGNAAIGMVSSGDPAGGDVFNGARIMEALEVLPAGYEIKLYVEAPTLVSPENGGTVGQGGTITGAVANAADGTEVIVRSTGQDPQRVAVTDGQWTITAPAESGEYAFTAQAVDGRNTSAVSSFTVDVMAAPMAEPTITSPADGGTFARVLSYNGTGTEGATVELQGAGIDGIVEVTVGADGNWRYEIDGGLPFSNDPYTVEARHATQGDRAASEWVSSTFNVKPGSVEITVPNPGTQFEQGTPNMQVQGTATADGAVSVGIVGVDGPVLVDAVDGQWGASLMISSLVPGDYEIIAQQTGNGVDGPQARSTFTIVAPAQPTEEPKPTTPPTTTPTPQPTCEVEVVVEIGPDGKPTVKAIPVDENCDTDGDGLPDTGANEMTMPLLAAGSALLLAGAGAVVFAAIRRRKAQH